MGHKRYLSQTSHMRGDCTTPKPPVTHFTGWYVLEYEIQQGVQQRAQSGLNRIPLLAELPYYDSLLIQNLGDPMHEEGNITKNLLRHMFGHVDELHHRRVCEEFNVHQEAWPYRRKRKHQSSDERLPNEDEQLLVGQLQGLLSPQHKL
ncbi:hypothetical protein R1sor_014257 [Riccia sorocarpa]|uniref:Uncharacterized protein n=1 Tax=Riccia sorocarpa TaxID=122646 RepID=A0ABD3H8V1_9MARC